MGFLSHDHFPAYEEVTGGKNHQRAPWRPYCSLAICKGASKKDAGRLFIKVCSDRTRGNNFKLRVDLGWNKEEFFYDKGSETLGQVAQRSGECPLPGNIQCQAGRGSEQPDLAEDVPAHCWGLD